MRRTSGSVQPPRLSLTSAEAKQMFDRLSRRASRRRMIHKAQRPLVAGVVLLASLAAAWGVFGAFENSAGRQPTTGVAGEESPTEPSPSPITLPPEGRTVFQPAPTGTTSRLTADQALATYVKENPAARVPADATAQLGYYTAAVGDGTYRFRNRLVWGFSWFGCAAAPSFPQGSPAPAASPGGTCRSWLFVDANTGEMLEGVIPTQ